MESTQFSQFNYYIIVYSDNKVILSIILKEKSAILAQHGTATDFIYLFILSFILLFGTPTFYESHKAR